MLDPLVSLALAVHSNKGVYAVLVGSGISHAAQIPTGWDVIIDLIRKLAFTMDKDPEPDPEAWYKKQFGEEPSYSKLLGLVAGTPAERQQLLKSYFEPNEQDREDGRKQPTTAHRAIARMAASGHVKVIITPNFDRLTERSLEEVGIYPAVISTADAVDGALPLTHSGCTVIKVHGDYLDTRIRNTPEELAEYDARMNRLLDQVLDEFGLIICGWSADWDPALRDAFYRCKSRRFSTYWAARGQLGQQAQELINFRGAVVVPISGADQFFAELAEKVQALEECDRPHPLSAQIAVATIKRFLPEERHRIRLHDLVVEETNRTVTNLNKTVIPLVPTLDETAGIPRFLSRAEAATEILAAIMSVGCYWGKDEQAIIWAEVVQRCLVQASGLDGQSIEVIVQVGDSFGSECDSMAV